MTPEPPADLNIIGHRILALLKAGEGMILSLERPHLETAGAILLGAARPALHVAFFPALTVNLPPGTKPSPETLREASKRPAVAMMVRTHEGPLPEAVQALAVDLMPPETFAVLRGRAITSLGKPLDGSRGIALEIEGGYLLQIDLTGAAVYQRETPDAQRS